MSGQQKYLRDTDLATRYSISRSTVWRWRARGLLPEPIVIGGSTRWKLSDIEEFDAQRDSLVHI
jgi:prophage regulatory protein